MEKDVYDTVQALRCCALNYCDYCPRRVYFDNYYYCSQSLCAQALMSRTADLIVEKCMTDKKVTDR